jgi:hypothetical protein
MMVKKMGKGEISRPKRRPVGVKEGGKKVKEVRGERSERSSGNVMHSGGLTFFPLSPPLAKRGYLPLSLSSFSISPPLANMPLARVFPRVRVRGGEISPGKEAA